MSFIYFWDAQASMKDFVFLGIFEISYWNLLQTELIADKGYPVETHTVQTKDGYLLSIQRIPFGRTKSQSNTPNLRKKVVFLQHGLLSSSTDWVINFPTESLGSYFIFFNFFNTRMRCKSIWSTWNFVYVFSQILTFYK